MPYGLKFGFGDSGGGGCDMLGSRGIDDYDKDSVECIEVWKEVRMLDVFCHPTQTFGCYCSYSSSSNRKRFVFGFCFAQVDEDFVSE